MWWEVDLVYNYLPVVTSFPVLVFVSPLIIFGSTKPDTICVCSCSVLLDSLLGIPDIRLCICLCLFLYLVMDLSLALWVWALISLSSLLSFDLSSVMTCLWWLLGALEMLPPAVTVAVAPQWTSHAMGCQLSPCYSELSWILEGR